AVREEIERRHEHDAENYNLLVLSDTSKNHRDTATILLAFIAGAAACRLAVATLRQPRRRLRDGKNNEYGQQHRRDSDREHAPPADRGREIVDQRCDQVAGRVTGLKDTRNPAARSRGHRLHRQGRTDTPDTAHRQTVYGA